MKKVGTSELAGKKWSDFVKMKEYYVLIWVSYPLREWNKYSLGQSSGNLHE